MNKSNLKYVLQKFGLLKPVTKLVRTIKRNALKKPGFNGVVLNGPFKGMQYPDSSFNPRYIGLSQLGIYEHAIHEWINSFDKYDFFINIGCADGYYAIGIAFKFKKQVLAFDIDKNSIELAKHFAIQNNVENLVDIRNEYCTNLVLNSSIRNNTLIFLDIEGGEQDVLNLEEVPNLKKTDILVETHDYIRPNITENIIKQFDKSHNISIKKLSKYNNMISLINMNILPKYLMIQERGYDQNVLLLESRSSSSSSSTF